MLSACGHSKQMEIKAADISDLEKNRMDVAASQAFTAEAVNIGEGISSADMYIEHYQKGSLLRGLDRFVQIIQRKKPIPYNLFILRMKRGKERINIPPFILAL
ncbi:putative sulfur oxidoreductase [Bacillus subtilis XF-1]|nr:putative sulfur oxidoreductase [Bacillus subtilis XF-1]ASK22898.1 putative sulfur oxidoreductase [Bacillus subtilis]